MFSSDKWFGAEAGFYNGVATTSLRFDSASTAYLTRTPSSAGNTRTFTFSAWFKKSKIYTSLASGQFNPILSAGDGVSDFGLLAFSGQANGSANDKVNQVLYYDYDAGADYSRELNRSFSDSSAWYHFVFAVDTTDATEANRVKYYINGVLQTAVESYHGAFPQNRETSYNRTDEHMIGKWHNQGGVPTFDGYMAEINFVDGTQYDASYFGESKNGAWIPIDTSSLTFGTNGYRLQFKQTGTGTASSSTIGADTSGNDNHWTSSGIVASDCNMPDSPENNFCTYNPLDAKGNDNTYSEGNLKVVVNAQNQDEQTTATFGVSSGKWYWEHRLISTTTTAGYFKIAIRGTDGDLPVWAVRGSDGETVNPDGSTGSSSVSYTTGNVIGVYLDMDNGKWYVSVDGTLQNSANLTNGTGYLHNTLTGTVRPFILNASSGGTHTGMGNFGQDSTFGGLETAGGYSDANGNGDFHSAVTSPYLALCSANLPEPTIGPNSLTQADDYFNTVLYTGNGQTAAQGSNAISGVGFQPDWVWLKKRDSDGANVDHALYDSTRGINAAIFSSANGAEGTFSNQFKSFDSDGFTVALADDTSFGLNRNSSPFVAWNWKANGGTTTTNDASATGVGSIDSVYQANTTAGFSIVTYTGSSSGTNGTPSTIAHGLGAVPKWIWFLPRDQYDGCVYHGANTSAPATDRLILKASQSSDAAGATSDDSLFFNDTEPTSTVFSVGTRKHANSNGGMVAYCFADVEGYSKFGGFVGNGNAEDGAFVYTGFSPAWILIKNTARSADWRLHDIARQPTNDSGGHILLPNSSSAEVTNEYDMDFLSNGFKMRTSSVYAQGSGETVIYMAFAEAPFKYANAR